MRIGAAKGFFGAACLAIVGGSAGAAPASASGGMTCDLGRGGSATCDMTAAAGDADEISKTALPQDGTYLLPASTAAPRAPRSSRR
jgi:hypothetical protein